MPSRTCFYVAIRAMMFMLSAPAQALQSQPQLAEWSISRTPVLSLGGEGTPNTQFLRISAVFRLQAGLVAVVNGGSNEIRLFDEQGKLVRTFGRTGGGPGEFRWIGWAGRSGDTVFVFDHSLQRVATILLGREPRLLGSIAVMARGSRGRFSVVGRLADGRWLVATSVMPGWDGPPGVYRVPGSVGVMPADATGDVRWLGEFPSMAIFVYNPTGDIKQAAVGPIAFTPLLHAVASGPHVWFGESGSYSLVRHDSHDGTRSALHLPFSRTAPSSSLIAARRARDLATARDARSRAFTEAKYSSTYLTRTLPLYETLVPGPGGELWIQRYVGVRTDSARYLVVGADLKPRAWVSVPRGVRVQEVGSDYVLCVHEDEDGVESVRLYRLQRR